MNPRAATHRALGSVLLATCLPLSACALQAREGDGLVSDGLHQSYAFGSAAKPQNGASGGGGLPDGDEVRHCKNVALFTQQVTPHFIERCVECHDGTKLKAVLALDLFEISNPAPASQQYACDMTLSVGVTLEDRVQSTIFTEVDPARADLDHDFKYPDAASFAAYRDAVMLWLQTE